MKKTEWLDALLQEINHPDGSGVHDLTEVIAKNLTHQDHARWWSDPDARMTRNVASLYSALWEIFPDCPNLGIQLWERGHVILDGVTEADIASARGMLFDARGKAKTFYAITTHNAEMAGYFIAGQGSSPVRAKEAADLRYERDGELTDIYEQTHAINARFLTGAEAQERFGHFEFADMIRRAKEAEIEAEYYANEARQ